MKISTETVEQFIASLADSFLPIMPKRTWEGLNISIKHYWHYLSERQHKRVIKFANKQIKKSINPSFDIENDDWLLVESNINSFLGFEGVFVNSDYLCWEIGSGSGCILVKDINDISYQSQQKFFATKYTITIRGEFDTVSLDRDYGKCNPEARSCKPATFMMIECLVNFLSSNQDRKNTASRVKDKKKCGNCGALNIETRPVCEYCSSKLNVENNNINYADDILIYDAYSHFIDRTLTADEESESKAIIVCKIKNIGEQTLSSISIIINFLDSANNSVFTHEIKNIPNTLKGNKSVILEPGDIWSRDLYHFAVGVPQAWNECSINIFCTGAFSGDLAEINSEQDRLNRIDDEIDDEFDDEIDDEFDDEIDDEFDDGLDERYPNEINEEKLVEQRDDGMWYRFDSDDLYTGPWGKNAFIKNGKFAKTEQDRLDRFDDELDANILKLKATAACVDCNLSGADLSGADLSEADLYGADLSHANLTNADITFALLSRANLTNADLSHANLEGSRLRYVNLTNADLSGAKLKGVNTDYAIFCNTKTPWGLDNSGCK